MPGGQLQGVLEVEEQAGRYVANAAGARRAKVVRGMKGLIVTENRKMGMGDSESSGEGNRRGGG